MTSPTNEHREQAREIMYDGFEPQAGSLGLDSKAVRRRIDMIASALSSRDAEVREDLEEFKVADCWCDYGAIFNLHSKRCLKTQALYSKLQAPELQEGLGQSKENSNVDQ